MPLGLLTEGMVPPGRSLGEVEGLEWLEEGWEGDKEWPKYTLTDPPPRLSPSSIVYVGLRDVDQEEVRGSESRSNGLMRRLVAEPTVGDDDSVCNVYAARLGRIF